MSKAHDCDDSCQHFEASKPCERDCYYQKRKGSDSLIETLKRIEEKQIELIKIMKQDFGNECVNIFEKIEKAMEEKKDE